MRQFAITYAQSAGVGLGKAADQLGICDVTLRSWIRAAKRPGAFLPVVVADEVALRSQAQPSSTSSRTLWMWSLSCHDAAFYRIDPSRGHQVIVELL